VPKKKPHIPKYTDIFKKTINVLGTEVSSPYFNESSISYYFELCLLNRNYEDLSEKRQEEICDLTNIYFFENFKPSA